MTGRVPRSARARSLLRSAAFVSTFDRFAMLPMLVAVAVEFDASLVSVVNAAGVYFLAYGLMQPVWGLASDRIGLVRTMRLTLLLAAVATVAGTFATSPWSWGVARGLTGACFSAAIPAALIYLGDTVPAPLRQREIAGLMTGVAVGTALASASAGVLAQYTSWKVPFLVTGAVTVLLVIALRRLPEPPRSRAGQPVSASWGRVWRSRPARLVLLLVFVEGAALLGAFTLIPPAVEAAGASTTVAGAVTAAYGVAVLLAAPLVGRMSRRTPTSHLIVLGAVAATLACVLVAVSRTPAVAVVGAALLGVGWAAMHSSLQTWATEVLPEARSLVVSLFAGALFLGSAVGTVSVGELAGAGRYQGIYWGAAALCLVLGVCASRGRADWRRSGGGPSG
ncbi:MFS transporter [Streptomyces sp. NPDC059256]|uniref:MFS transporter n=1 Tax=Streptomyces sp. NPDC059256 TaxID=3346794 RepID=UPI0036B6F955